MGRVHNSNPRVGMKTPLPQASFLSHDVVAIASASCPTKRVCVRDIAVCRTSLWKKTGLPPRIVGPSGPGLWLCAGAAVALGPWSWERVLDLGTRPQEAGPTTQRPREEPGFHGRPFPAPIPSH